MSKIKIKTFINKHCNQSTEFKTELTEQVCVCRDLKCPLSEKEIILLCSMDMNAMLRYIHTKKFA